MAFGGKYAHDGSDSRKFPVSIYALALDPPHTPLNSQDEHFPKRRPESLISFRTLLVLMMSIRFCSLTLPMDRLNKPETETSPVEEIKSVLILRLGLYCSGISRSNISMKRKKGDTVVRSH